MDFSIFSFPFRQIGSALRQLSLSSSAGNGAAILLYAVICLLPVIWLAFRVFRLKRGLAPMDLWLPVISAGLFLVIYVMINPGCLPSSLAGMEGSDLCICFWSAIIVWLVLNLLKTIQRGDEKQQLRYLQMGIIALAAWLALTIPAGIFTRLLPQIEALEAGNADPARAVMAGMGYGDPLKPSIIFLWFKYLMDCIPTAALLPVFRAGYVLTGSLGQDKYSAETVAATDTLCRICVKVLPVIVIEPFVMNLLQLAGGGLRSLTFNVHFPVAEMVLVICVLLLAKFFASAKALKDENGMII